MPTPTLVLASMPIPRRLPIGPPLVLSCHPLVTLDTLLPTSVPEIPWVWTRIRCPLSRLLKLNDPAPLCDRLSSTVSHHPSAPLSRKASTEALALRYKVEVPSLTGRRSNLVALLPTDRQSNLEVLFQIDRQSSQEVLVPIDLLSHPAMQVPDGLTTSTGHPAIWAPPDLNLCGPAWPLGTGEPSTRSVLVLPLLRTMAPHGTATSLVTSTTIPKINDTVE